MQKYNANTGLGETLKKKTALLVIDVQNDFCAPSGVIARSGRKICALETAIRAIKKLKKMANKKQIPIVFTRLVYDLNRLPALHAKRMKIKNVAGLCKPNSVGTQFYKIKPTAEDMVIEKNCYSAFYKTGLGNWLKKNKIQTIVLTGVTTHICPLLTAADAYYRGYQIVTVKDALGTYEVQNWSLKYMRDQFAAIAANSDEILQAWQETR